MGKIKTTKWNILDHLNNEKAIAAYLQVVADENDPDALISAIGTAARARGINKMAKEMGVNRESLYKSFSGRTKPQFETVYKAIDKLGLQIVFRPKAKVSKVRVTQ